MPTEYLDKLKKILEGKIFLVGGFVRDSFFERETYDYDIVTEGDPYKLAKDFSKEVNGSLYTLSQEFKIIRVITGSGKTRTTFDFSKIKGKDIIEDLSYRDFTINAMAIEIHNADIDFDKVIDPYGGLEDIKRRVLKGINKNIFQNDPLRMLRAVRLMADLDLDIDDETLELIRLNSKRIKEVPMERVADEFFKILGCKRAHYYLNLMDKYMHLLNKILPEIEPMKDIGQCKYHVVDSWTHSLHTMRVIEKIIYADGYFEDHLRKAYEEHTDKVYSNGHSKIQLMKLAALIHDIGKPVARWVDEEGRVRFRGHEISGAEIAAQISERLKLSNKEKEYLCKIVKEHMWPLTLYKTNDVSGKALYDLFKNFGESTLDIILIGLADIISTRQLLNPHEEMGMYKVHAEYLANNYLTRFKRLEDINDIINGNDILEKYEIKDRRQIGEIIDSIKRAIFFGEIPLERDRIFKYIEEKLL